MRKQIGLRMKDETRDQLERVRGGLSRTDYIEGAVLAQIARDLKDPDMPSLEDYRNAPSGIGPLAYEWEDKPHRLVYDLIKRLGWSCPEGEFPNSKEPKAVPAIREGELRDGSRIEDGEVYEPVIEKPFFGGGIMGPPIGPQGDIKPQITPQDNPHDFPDSERCDCGVVSRGLINGKCADCRDKEKALLSGYFKGFPVRSSAESRAGVVPVPKKAVKGRK